MRKTLFQLKEELQAAGFRPAPLAPALHLIRRLIWPIIRQYHFYQLEELDSLSQQFRSQMETQASRLADQFALASENARSISSKLTEELSKLVTSHFQLQSDLAAVSNRQVARLAADDAADEALRAIETQHAKLMERVLALKHYQEELELQFVAPFQHVLPQLDSFSNQPNLSSLPTHTPPSASPSPTTARRQFHPLETTLGSALRACAEHVCELRAQLEATRSEFSTLAACSATRESLHAAAIAELKANTAAVKDLQNAYHHQSDQRIAGLELSLKQLPAASALHRIVDLSAKSQVLINDVQRLRSDLQTQSSANSHLSSQLALGLSLLGESTRKAAELESNQRATSATALQQEKTIALLADRLLELSGDIQTTTASIANCWSHINSLDRRTTLSFVYTPERIFITKSGDLIGETLAETGAWDAHIVSAGIQTAASRHGTAVDVGAHIGTISCALSQHFDRIVCFEPNRFTFPLLKANLALNGIQNVEAIPAALYSRELDLSLACAADQEVPLPLTMRGDFDPLLASNLGALAFTPNGTGIFKSAARTLDSYGLQDVSFLKVDAQGSDGEVLLGAKDTILRCKPVIVFEWEDILAKSHGVSLDILLAFLLDWGYHVEILKQTNEKQTDYIARPV